jgi:hypothetical protein
LGDDPTSRTFAFTGAGFPGFVQAHPCAGEPDVVHSDFSWFNGPLTLSWLNTIDGGEGCEEAYVYGAVGGPHDASALLFLGMGPDSNLAQSGWCVDKPCILRMFEGLDAATMAKGWGGSTLTFFHDGNSWELCDHNLQNSAHGLGWHALFDGAANQVNAPNVVVCQDGNREFVPARSTLEGVSIVIDLSIDPIDPEE